jgi:hypothetical protein
MATPSSRSSISREPRVFDQARRAGVSTGIQRPQGVDAVVRREGRTAIDAACLPFEVRQRIGTAPEQNIAKRC